MLKLLRVEIVLQEQIMEGKHINNALLVNALQICPV